MKKVFVLLALVITGFSISAQENYVYVENGRLYFPDGKELSLWGVNLQPCLSWEYNNLMSKVGVPYKAEEWKRICDESLDELALMNNQIVRCHLTPADFTDSAGNLVETIYLDLLDYMVAETKKKGMYLYIAFMNDMGSWEIENSFINGTDRKAWVYDEEIASYSMNYLSQLLKRTNPYTQTTYSSDTAFAVWEIINEPHYYSYDDMGSSVYNSAYLNWLENSDLENTENNYKHYRKGLVLDYINQAYDTIRAAGAAQPVVWNCNWHRMINGREDVFDAIAESKVEVVSFCNYPGQDMVAQDYWNNPTDLTETDFAEWLANSYEKYNWYGWTRDEKFSDKAKVVYEFETFFNQSAYLYAAQAKLFRSLGVQIATMWHYSMPEYAAYRGGAHLLNLKCTPRKAGSFIVANEIFNSVPLFDYYDTESTTELTSDNYMFSYNRDLCVFSSDDKFYYSNSFHDQNISPLKESVTEIIGYGDSPYVKYEGSGLYFLNKLDGNFKVDILPNAEWLKEPWKYGSLYLLVTELTTANTDDLEVNLDGEFTRVINENESQLFVEILAGHGFLIQSNEIINSIVVYSANGQIVFNQDNFYSSKAQVSHRFNAGIYIVKINDSDYIKVWLQ